MMLCRSCRYPHHASAGFSLIEAAIVLGIVGLIVGGVFAVWGNVNSQQKVKAATEQVTVIVNNLRNSYANRSRMEVADITAGVVLAEIAPRTWTNGTDTIYHPWRRQFTTNPGTLVVRGVTRTSTGDTIRLFFDNIDNQGDCLNFANAVLNFGKSNGLVAINATAITAASDYNNIRAAVCTTATPGINDLTFDFLLHTN